MLGKKIPTLIALILLGVLAGWFWLWQQKGDSGVVADIAPTSIKITNIADNKFSVSWTTKTETLGQLEYGSVGEKLDQKQADDRGQTFVGKTHHITISNLQPSTNYAFRILSGENQVRFDNQGSVYTATTGKTLGEVPAARSLYGDVTGGTQDTIVYVTLPNAQSSSTTLKSGGSYSIPLSTIRSADLNSFVSYDPAATVVSLLLDNGNATSQVSVSTKNITPVPTIAMGKNADFREGNTLVEQPAQIAQVVPQIEPQADQQPGLTAEPPQVFNVEPFPAAVNEIVNASYTLLNPAVEGEVLSTTKPEFRGTGAGNATINISITGQKAVSDSLRVGADGTWKWSPAIALSVGRQKITIEYTDKDGKKQQIARNFSISTGSSTSLPSFEATPSASIASSPTPTPLLSPSPLPSTRVSIPATESGVPVTGVMTPMLLTLGLGFAIMVLGAFLLAL